VPGVRRTRLHPLRASWGDVLVLVLAVGAVLTASLV
jgi:hypothetical protein